MNDTAPSLAPARKRARITNFLLTVGLLVAAILALGTGSVPIPPNEVTAGFAVALVVFLLGRNSGYFGHGLLLAGIAVGELCSSLPTAMLYLAGERLQAVVFWLMGGLWRANWQHVALLAPVCLTGLVLLAPSWVDDCVLPHQGKLHAHGPAPEVLTETNLHHVFGRGMRIKWPDRNSVTASWH